MEEPSPPLTSTTNSTSLSGPNVRLKRHRERGSHERDSVFAIIDEALLAHVAFSVDGTAMTLPTAHTRIDDQLYLHGARANRMLRALCEAGRASATFTLIDGLVLARTAFHHSMNYRSAFVLGTAREVTDRDEKRLALRALIEQIAPGRMRELADPTDSELEQTLVICLSIEEASVKTRAGDPVDAQADLALDVWAGTVPLTLTPGAPKPDAALRPDQTFSNAAAARALPRVERLEVTHGPFVLSNDPARLQFELIYRFLSIEAYWCEGISREQLRRSMQGSLCFGAYLGDCQVGFARVVSDGARFAYLCDVFVDSAQRGQGLGTALVSFALDHPSVRDAERWLLGTRDAHSLYEGFGFARTTPGRYMARPAPR
jgi:nitroimidazol reductase NimA-like FMN-containing flavoprotein (pyridoxamine 5'-phosphate oxidase superfamily)/GNAT superfamily N-acetyltransferase